MSHLEHTLRHTVRSRTTHYTRYAVGWRTGSESPGTHVTVHRQIKNYTLHTIYLQMQNHTLHTICRQIQKYTSRTMMVFDLEPHVTHVMPSDGEQVMRHLKYMIRYAVTSRTTHYTRYASDGEQHVICNLTSSDGEPVGSHLKHMLHYNVRRRATHYTRYAVGWRTACYIRYTIRWRTGT